MKKVFTSLPEINLVGLTARTNNMAEMNPSTAKIKPTMEKFFGEKIQEKIQNKKNPGKIFAVYTQYESDFTGDYTYFMGEEVTSLKEIEKGLETLTLPGQEYVTFTSEPGTLPGVVIEMWQKIWQMDPASLGGTRGYVADFEIYDARSHDPLNAVLDIYIGVKKDI